MSLFEQIEKRAQGMKSNSPLLDLHPELAGRVHVFSGSTEGIVTANAGYTETSRAYMVSAWVHRAIDLWADNIAPLPVGVFEIDSSGDKKRVSVQEIDRLLNEPNPTMDPVEFWKQWAIELGISGEFGIEVSANAGGSMVEMWPKQSPVIEVVSGLSGARYREVIGYIIDDGEQPNRKYKLVPEEFIFYKFYNPRNVFRGLSRMQAVKLDIDIDLLSQVWGVGFYKNNARPDYAVMVKQGTSRTEKNELRENLEERHSMGAGGKSWLPILLEDEYQDIKTLGYPPKDLEWVAQREFSRDDIAGIYGIPDEIMGFGKNTYENFDTADRIVWTGTYKPLAEFRDAALTAFFKDKRKILRPNQFVMTDFSNVPQLQEDKADKIEQWAKMVEKGVPSVTASSVARLNLPRYEGDTVGYVSGLLQPVNTATGPEARAIALEVVKMLGDGQVQKLPATTKQVPEFGSDEHKQLLDGRRQLLFPFQEEMRRGLRKFFQRQEVSVMRNLRDAEQRTYGRGKFVGKGPDDIPDPQSLFDQAFWTAAFFEAFDAIVERSYAKVGADWFSKLPVTGEFDVQDPINQSWVKFILDVQARETTNTTWLGLIDIFERAESEGLGIPAIQEEISAFFVGRKSFFQTERIARTTMNAVDNRASQAAFEQSEVVRTKVWISALLPGRTREAHAFAHGQEVPLGEAFEVDGEALQHPGDPQGSAGNIINCLCVQVPGEVIE